MNYKIPFAAIYYGNDIIFDSTNSRVSEADDSTDKPSEQSENREFDNRLNLSALKIGSRYPLQGRIYYHRGESYFYLNVGKSGPGVMAKTADHVAGVAVVVRMAAEGRIKAMLAAFLGGADILVHGVDGLQNTARELLEFAELDRFVYAVVLEVVVTFSGLEGVRSGDG